MQLTILGSGTCIPTIKRASPGYFLETNSMKILIDCGPGTLRQLIAAKKDYKDIDAVILSHLHSDHVSDLFTLIQALSWTPELKNKNKLFNRYKNLYFIGSQGFKKWYSSIQKINLVQPRPNTFKIIVKEFKKQQNFKTIKIETLKGKHSPFSSFIKISFKNKNLVYCGDSDYEENIIKLAKNTNLLILECAWPDKYKMPGHLTPSECGQLATKAKAKKLLLTHFYPPMEKVNIKKVVRKYYKGPIILAKDLMQIKV